MTSPDSASPIMAGKAQNRFSELPKHEHTACHKNFLSLCFLALPLGYPPNPQLLAHDLGLFFS